MLINLIRSKPYNKPALSMMFKLNVSLRLQDYNIRNSRSRHGIGLIKNIGTYVERK